MQVLHLQGEEESWQVQEKVDVGILVGYSSSPMFYRVYNEVIDKVEESYDVEFDETNGSQGEQAFEDCDVGEEPLRQ